MEILRRLSESDRSFNILTARSLPFLQEILQGQEQTVTIRQSLPFGEVCVESMSSGVAEKNNEDSFVILPMGKGRTLLAVLDGASCQKKVQAFEEEKITGAFYISRLVSAGFKETPEYKELCETEELSAKKITEKLNKWVFDQLKQIPGVDYSDIPTVPGMAAAFLLVDPQNSRLSIAQVADATMIAVGANFGVKVLTPNLNAGFDAETMSYIAQLAEHYGVPLSGVRKIPEGKEKVRLQLANSFSRKTNKKGGCGIMNGMRELFSNNLVYTQDIPMDGRISSIILVSDGAIQPYMQGGTSVETAARSLVESYYSQNKKTAFLEKGAVILDNDSEFKEIPRIKHRDDATILEVRFKGFQ